MRTILAIILTLAMAMPCLAADKALLAKIQAAYSQINSFAADFTQTLTHKESGATEKRQGHLEFQKPLLVRWQTAKPHAETLIVNEKEIWDYLPDEEIAYRYSPAVAQDSRSIIQVLTGQAKLDKNFDVKAGGSQNGLTMLILYPREPSPQMVESTIWVNPATGTIQRARVVDFYGNSNDVAFQSLTPGAKIPPGQFKFKAPKGVEVEDRIERTVPERDLFK